VTARIDNIGKNHRWAAKDVVLQLDARIHGDVILNFYVVSDPNPGRNHDVLAEIATFTE
jgi:hypothetical protein